MFDLAITMERDKGRCKLGEHDARIVCTDLAGDEPLGVAWTDQDGQKLTTRSINGHCWSGHQPLTTLPETKVSYASLYETDGYPWFGNSLPALEGAITGAKEDSLGIYKLSLTDGVATIEKVKL
jgi:hypothetical protein